VGPNPTMKTNELRPLESIVREATDCHDPCYLGVDEEGFTHFYSLSRPLVVAVSPSEDVDAHHFDELPISTLSEWAAHVDDVHDGWDDGPKIANSELDDGIKGAIDA